MEIRLCILILAINIHCCICTGIPCSGFMELNYEAVLLKTGWGTYYKFLLILCCISNVALAIVYMSIFVIVPFSMCNVRYSSSSILKVIALFSLGSAVGGYLNCCIFDWLGRKSPVTLFLVLTFCGCFSAAFSTGSTMLALCIFFTGFSYLTAKIAIRIYVMENMSMKCRGKIGVLLDIFWIIGFINAFAISLAYIPSLALHSADLKIASWRMFSALSGVLCIMTSCVTALTFNSPRYLLMKKHFIEAKETLKHIYAINCSQHADNWPATPEIDITDIIQPQFFNEERPPTTCYEGIIRILKRVKILTLILNRKEYKNATYLLVCLKITLFPCTFTICILMSSVIKKFESVDYFNYTILSPNYMLSTQDILLVFKTFDYDQNQCLFEIKFLTFYLTLGFLLSAAAGVMVLYKIIEKFGRKKLLRISFFVCAITCFVQIFSLHMYTRIIISAVLSFFFAIAESIINIITVESYPTRLRGTGNGFVHFFPAIVQGCMFAYLNLPCYVIFSIYSTFLIVGLILSSFVKDLRMKSMVE